MNINLIRKILWDYDFSDDEIIRIYNGELEIGGMNEHKLKARLLNSYSWYTLIREIGFEDAKKLMQPEIIRYIYPKSLQQKYSYAASLL